MTAYVQGVANALKETWVQVGKKLKTNQIALNKPVQEPRKFKELAIGQMVMLRTIPKLKYKSYMDKKEYQLSKKLQFRYSGPFPIIRKLSPVTYELQLETRLKIVSVKNLKPL